MGRPVTKDFLGSVTTEVKLGPMRGRLAKWARAENIWISDLILRECGHYLTRRGEKVDPRILNPTPIQSRVQPVRLLAAASGGRRR